MCTHVRIGDKVCSTPRQLAPLVGGAEAISWLDHHGAMDWCLCVVDVPRTLDRASIRWIKDKKTETYIVER